MDADADEYEYGEVMEGSRILELRIDGRQKGSSFASSASSLSPTLSHNSIAASELPFSIDRRPPVTSAAAAVSTLYT